MKKIQIENKVFQLSELDEFQLDYQKDEKKKINKNKIILCFAVFVIIFLLIPKFNFINNIPKVGDLVKKDFIVESNVLLKDQDATKFKIEKNISNLGVFLDYDPLAYQKLTEKTLTVFQDFLARNEKIAQQKFNFQEKKRKIALSNLTNKILTEEIKQEEKIYQTYLNFLEEKKQTNNIYLLQKKNNLASRKNSLEQEKKKIQEEIEKTTLQNQDFLKNIEVSYDNSLSQLFQDLELSFDQEIFSLLAEIVDYELFLTRLLILLKNFERNYVLKSKEIIKSSSNQKIQIFNLETGKPVKNPQGINFLNLEDAKQIMKEYIKENFQENATHLNLGLYLLASKIIIPTSFENKQKLETQRKIITNEKNSVFINLEKGTVLVKAGEVLNEEKRDLIASYYNNLSQGKSLIYIFGVIILIFLIIFIIFIALKMDRKSTDAFYEHFVVLLFSLAVGLIVIYFTKGMLEIFSKELSLFTFSNYFYALPITLASMLSGSLYGFKTNIATAFLTAFCVTFYLEENFLFFIYCWISSSFTCLIFVNLNTRFDLIKKGVLSALINIIILLVIELLRDPSSISKEILQALFFAFTGGIFSTIFNIIFLPLLEQLFGISTQLKLLELSNLNHPLLKLLQNRCLGTYQHSILVGSLAEAGAQKIGVNPLLIKIGAYYHDIGKAIEPEYFNENYQESQKSIHDTISPKESAKKIINHIIYGIQLANKFKLGKRITEFILEHHGDSTIEFFYQKACKQKGEKVSTEDFHYPMPRPRSIETAVIMLADSSEVTVRSLKQVDKKSITKTINNVFQNIADNRQLDLSGMSIEQLRTIKTVFIDILVSLNHNRYMGQKV